MENNIITLIESATKKVAIGKGRRKLLTEKYINPAHRRKVLTEKLLPRTTCLYLHVNTTLHEIFYCGIGNDRRPYANYKGDRSLIWFRTVKKYDYIVVVIETRLTWEQACEKEIYWIARIGRRDLKEGTLINLTDGGDGNYGHIMSEEQKNQIRLNNTGRVSTKLIDLTGQKFGELTIIRRAKNSKQGQARWICNCDCGNSNIERFGHTINSGEITNCGPTHKHYLKTGNIPILQIDKVTGKILSAFNSKKAAIKLTDVPSSTIDKFLNKESKLGGGYDWKIIPREEYTLYKEYYDISLYKYIKPKCSQKVIAIFPDKTEQEFKSLSEAGRELKMHKQNSVALLLANGKAHKKTGIKFKEA